MESASDREHLLRASLDATTLETVRTIALWGSALSFVLAGVHLLVDRPSRLDLAGLDALLAAALASLAFAIVRGRIPTRLAQLVGFATMGSVAVLLLAFILLAPGEIAASYAVVTSVGCAAVFLSRKWLLAAVFLQLTVLVGFATLKPPPMAFQDLAGLFLSALGASLVIHEARLRIAMKASALRLALEERQRELESAFSAKSASEARFRALVENIPEVFYHVNVDFSKTLYVSPAFTTLWGIPVAEMERDPAAWIRSVHPDDRGNVIERLRQFNDPNATLRIECRIVRPDGSIRHVDSRTVLLHGAEGAEFAGVVEDVTERYEAMERLRGRERTLSQALDVAHMGTFAFSRDPARVEWSESIFTIFGRDPREGAPTFEEWVDCVHPDDRERVRAVALGSFDGGSELEEACRILRPDGEIRYVRARARVEQVASGPARVVGILQDVTEERRTAAALEASRHDAARRDRLESLGTLVAGIAHEINNPLQYMLGNVELTRDTLNDILADETGSTSVRAAASEARKRQGVVLQGIERISHITRGLRQVARSSSGPRAPIDVNDAMEDVLAVVSNKFDPGTEVVKDLRARKRAVASEYDVTQVLLNLLLNAADATRGLLPSAVTLRSREEGDRIVIEVADTGRGIPADVQRKVFTPFFTTKPDGTGLGLSVCYQIAHANAGRLTFTSEEGRGSTFRLELPVST